MAWYAEVQTVHLDGRETWQRWRCASEETARREADALLIYAFGDHCGGVTSFPDIGGWTENDFGEPCCVRAVEYGARSQIRTGVFTVDWRA